MEITNHTIPQHRHILLIKGLVREQAFDRIKTELAAMPQDQTKELWIDCSHIDRPQVTSSSICSFVSELLKIRKQGIKVVLCGMNATTERLFQLLRLDTLFEKARNADETELQDKSQSLAA